jgi:hypothetical protein
MMLGLPFSLWNYSPPLGFIIMVLYFLTFLNLSAFIIGMSMNSDRKYYVKSFKKLLEIRSKKWNITIIADQDQIINELISNQKHYYLISGYFWFWPILYLFVVQSSWSPHRTFFIICVICVSLSFINDYFKAKSEKKIILAAGKQ